MKKKKTKNKTKEHQEQLKPKVSKKIKEEVQVITRYNNTAKVKNSKGIFFSSLIKKSVENIVAGDQAVIETLEDGCGYAKIIEIKKRKNEIYRINQNKNKIIAANIDQMIVVSATNTGISSFIIDKYLITSEYLKIQPIILINKMDLCSEQEIKEIKELLNIYEDLKYKVIFYSKEDSNGYKQLMEEIKGKSNILVGQSGVGKSTIIKSIFPEKEIRIQEISAKSKLGKHTTTYTTLFEFKEGGCIIDSPGIRNFEVDHICKTSIRNMYKEIKEVALNCKFRDCDHITSKYCAVKTAIQEKKISQERYNNYKKIYSKRIEE